MVELTVRAAVVGDEPFLWRMLLWAAHAGDEVDGLEALKACPSWPAATPPNRLRRT